MNGASQGCSIKDRWQTTPPKKSMSYDRVSYVHCLRYRKYYLLIWIEEQPSIAIPAGVHFNSGITLIVFYNVRRVLFSSLKEAGEQVISLKGVSRTYI
ncbi:hypothetical protein DCM91_16260 [Chitinophaga costaii]|nr:hypothetical protein DCM91_16260 [Chitinophaga costaii]